MNKFLSFKFVAFDHFITPLIIKILFLAGVAALVISGLWQIKNGLDGEHFGGGLLVLLGLVTLIVGPVAWRVSCEMMILLFRIHDSLKAIEKSVSRDAEGAIK